MMSICNHWKTVSPRGNTLFYALFHISNFNKFHKPDETGMLTFRSTVALKELFQGRLKWPLLRSAAVSVKEALPAACFTSVGMERRLSGGGGAVSRWRSAQNMNRSHGIRGFCSKGDGHHEAANKDTADK